MPVKAVFLDIDNTLLSFDDYVRDAMRVGFAEFSIGTYEPRMFSDFHEINGVLWKRIEEGTLTMDGLREIRWNLIFARLGLSYDGPTFERWFRERLFISAVEIPGALQLLRELHGNYILCAASNGPYDQQVNRLRLAGMLPYFEQVFVSETIGVSKPDPAFFQRCLQLLNQGRDERILPAECVMVGDSLRSDVSGALQAGMQAVHFQYAGAQTTEPAQHSLDNLKDLPGLLSRM